MKDMSYRYMEFLESNPDLVDLYEGYDKWMNWLYEAEQAHCKHPNMHYQSSAGPDGGYEHMHCSICGYSHYHQLY